MIERLIENWLTNSSERGYEVPFCQLLMAEGHRVIHLNRHSPTEQGKDIISVGPNGKLCAYQLKAGNIDLKCWRSEVKPEIEELIENIVDHPGVKPEFAIPYLVTNGRLSEPVIAQVTNLNRSYRKRKLKTLNVIVGTDLAARFLKCHARFLPQEPSDFDAFLRLFLADGRDLLSKARFAAFLEQQLSPQRCSKKNEVSRAIASAVILSSYALSPFTRAENHFAVFEGWILTASYIARLAEATHLAEKYWHPSFQLVLDAARAALASLVAEAMNRETFAEGNTLMDGGAVYRSRLTILAGTAAADALIAKGAGQDWPHASSFEHFLKDNARHLLLWGESAIPFFISLALYLEGMGRSTDAEALIQALIEAITQLNGSNRLAGLPNPYYGIQRCIAAMVGAAPNPMLRDSPKGSSFTLAALIEFMVRRWRKQTLKLLWYGVTPIHMSEMQYAQGPDFYRWRVRNGGLKQWFAKRPQPWSDLAAEAKIPPSSAIPGLLRSTPAFAIMFMLVYPHRFSRDMLKTVEDRVGEQDQLSVTAKGSDAV